MATGRKIHSLAASVEERAVVERLDQVRATIGHLQHLAAGEVELQLPAGVADDLEDALPRPDIDPIDVAPRTDTGLRMGSGGGEDAIEGDRRHLGRRAPLDRLDPRHLLLDLEQQAGHQHRRNGTATPMAPQRCSRRFQILGLGMRAQARARHAP